MIQTYVRIDISLQNRKAFNHEKNKSQLTKLLAIAKKWFLEPYVLRSVIRKKVKGKKGSCENQTWRVHTSKFSKFKMYYKATVIRTV